MQESSYVALLLIVMLAIAPVAVHANNEEAPRQKDEPLKLAVAGLVHAHVWGFLRDAFNREDIDVVGLYDPSPELLRRYGGQHKLPEERWFRDLDRMLDTTKPEAVAIFTNIKDHRPVVEACAPMGIHVMMEKPLAVTAADAHAIKQLADKHSIHALVNYETTWYPNTSETIQLIRDANKIGKVRKIIAYTGHQGPKEINMPDEFMDWLVVPELGGGALNDFGCYGANLATCVLDGQRPLRVTASTHQHKTDPVYKQADDDATIVLDYADAQVVILASWNWPSNRKDMAYYGDHGELTTQGADAYRLQAMGIGTREARAERPEPPRQDCLSYLKAVVRNEIKPAGPSSLEVNVIVSEILDAARRSAKTHQSVTLDKAAPKAK
jgi:predicted dehydrogenase